MVAAYILFAAVLFMAFLAASFPYVETISAFAAPMRLTLVFHAQRIGFPFGARLQGVQLISTATPREEVLVESPEVTIGPSLPWLLLGRPRLRIRAQIYGGLVDATVRRSARATAVDFEFDSLNLAKSSTGNRAALAGSVERPASTQISAGGKSGPAASLTPPFSAVLSGELSGSGSAQIAGPELTGDKARLVVKGRDVKLTITDEFPPLELGAISVDATLNRGRIMLNRFQAHGSDAEILANGEIQLAPSLAQSTLRLTVLLAPTSNGLARFGLFLKMLPRPPNQGPYRIEGSLSSPSVS